MKNDLFNLNIWWNLNILRDTLKGGAQPNLVLFFSGRSVPSLCILALKVSLSFVPTDWHGSFRKKQTHRQRRILNSNLQISCQDLPFPDGFDLKNKSKPWIRSVDYHLECCIEARFLKLAITGRSLPGDQRDFGLRRFYS